MLSYFFFKFNKQLFLKYINNRILIEAIKKINTLDEYCHGILEELKLNLM